MNHRAEYLLQVLEKIGAPLMASIIAVASKTDTAAPGVSEAQKIAELLGKTVQTGIELGYAIDLGPAGEMSDPVRLALSGVAAPLIGYSYGANSRAPVEADIKKIVAAMQAVLSFADNFSADSDHAGRLRDMDSIGNIDTAQLNVQYLYALVPVVNAVAAFPFGQPEQKLIVDITARLTTDAARINGPLNGTSKITEVSVLRALGILYAASHNAETARIMALPENQRMSILTGAGALDVVWKSYEMRAAMLQALAQGMVAPGSASGAVSGGGIAPQAAPPEAAPVTPPPLSPQPPQAPPVIAPQESQSPPPPAAPPATGANPMGFFKKPPPQEGS
jgi:hypothetical protein